jgi:hypothetical protein
MDPNVDSQTNNAPSAPTSSNDDGPAVGVRSHSAPARGKRSDRETGAAAKPAKPVPRDRGAPRERETANDDHNAMRKLVAKDVDDGEEETPEHDASGNETDGEEVSEGQEQSASDPVKAVQEKLTAAEAHIAEVHASAKSVIRENQMMTKRLAFYESALKEALEAANMEMDPRALKLMEFEAERELGTDDVKAQTQAQKAAEEAHVTKEVKRINAEATKAAKTAGVSAQSLARRYAVSVKDWMEAGEQGPEPTMSDVVAEIQAVSASKQAKVSSKAPSLARASTATTAAQARPTNDFAGWRQTLKQHGFAD